MKTLRQTRRPCWLRFGPNAGRLRVPLHGDDCPRLALRRLTRIATGLNRYPARRSRTIDVPVGGMVSVFVFPPRAKLNQFAPVRRILRLTFTSLQSPSSGEPSNLCPLAYLAVSAEVDRASFGLGRSDKINHRLIIRQCRAIQIRFASGIVFQRGLSVKEGLRTLN
jgi:hypothetical protein